MPPKPAGNLARSGQMHELVLSRTKTRSRTHEFPTGPTTYLPTWGSRWAQARSIMLLSVGPTQVRIGKLADDSAEP
jgi:hypothetical protein